jgi:signal transduction histidine kinase/ActR/RegA family two-component response regulator
MAFESTPISLPPFGQEPRPVRRGLTLRTKLLLLLAVGPFALALLLLVFLPTRINRQSQDWAESSALGLARLLASACSASVEFDDPASAVDQLEHLSTVRGAIYAVVFSDGPGDRVRVLTTWRQAQVPAGLQPGAEAVVTSGGLLHAQVPIVTRTGRTGRLVVGFGLQEIELRAAELRALVAMAALGLALLAILVGLVLTQILVVPLRAVTRVAERIAQGEETARRDLDRDRTDELGTLARAFDVMLLRLYEQQEELSRRGEDIRALNVRLEARVEERTAALAAANRELSASLAELKRTQEQLVVADRRVSIGRIAAGVAHEINNPLTYVKSNLTYAEDGIQRLRGAALSGAPLEARAVEQLGSLADALADASGGATRIQQIVRGLKTFSHGDEDVRAPVDVAAAIDAAVDMAWHQIKVRARFKKELGPAPRVDASEVRLMQVFLNLLVNAAQAIPEKAFNEHQISVVLRSDAAGRAVVEVSDTGCGIPQEIRSRLFEPFFTTKPTGVGTGLGLAVSHGIVESYGGRIEVESEVGRGTTFRVTLPASTLGTPHAVTIPPLPSVGRLRLLVVDDDVAIGTALTRALSVAFEVVAVSSGAEALARVAAGDPIDLVLCDLEMPGMTGPEVRAALARVAPQLAKGMLFMTGGPISHAYAEIRNEDRGRVLDKPIELQKLLEAVALRRRGSSPGLPRANPALLT